MKEVKKYLLKTIVQDMCIIINIHILHILEKIEMDAIE